MRKIKVTKPMAAISENMSEHLLSRVFHEIEVVEEAQCQDGPAVLVRLTSKTDFAPDVDVACLIHIRSTSGPVKVDQSIGAIGALDLWYWKEQFWIKGVDSLGIDYYAKIKGQKCYALCPIDVVNGDKLLSKAA